MNDASNVIYVPVWTFEGPCRRIQLNNTVYYATLTCWWTHRAGHLYQRTGIPCDPRGSTLFETDDPQAWMEAAREGAYAGHYGKHGLRALEAAHHENVWTRRTPHLPTSKRDWDAYNQLLDEWDALPAEEQQGRLRVVYAILDRSWGAGGGAGGTGRWRFA